MTTIDITYPTESVLPMAQVAAAKLSASGIRVNLWSADKVHLYIYVSGHRTEWTA